MINIELVVLNAVDTLLQENNITEVDVKNIELFGDTGVLNSLAIIRLVVEIEEEVFSQYKIAINLTDVNSFNYESSPFKNFKTLLHHVEKAINA